MSFTPGTFYAYMECESQNYFVAFPSRAFADKFWRAVQSIGNDDNSKECRRHGPQYFTVPVLPNGIETDGWNGNDRKSCFIHPINNNQSSPVAPPDSRPDNRNGGTFYIRSTLHPEYHWFYNSVDRQVEVSRARQSKFIIRRTAHHPSSPEGDILIGDDDITIWVVANEGQEWGQVLGLTRDQWNRLVGGDSGPFKFSYFDGGFEASEDGLVRVAGPCTGERWEFVA